MENGTGTDQLLTSALIRVCNQISTAIDHIPAITNHHAGCNSIRAQLFDPYIYSMRLIGMV
jgi:hypothetical protein